MPDVNAGNIQFWKVIEATANLAISSIEMAPHSGNDAEALHSEGIAALRSQIRQAGINISTGERIHEIWKEQPINPNYLTSETALEIASELLPRVREAIQKRDLDGSCKEITLIVALMATSLGA